MKQTFYSTTGLETGAGEMLWDNLDPKGLSKLMSCITQFRLELNKCESQLGQTLLYDYFKTRFDEPYLTYKLNVLKAVYTNNRTLNKYENTM